MSIRAKGTFERLRYSLGGDRPSQTAHQTLSPYRVTAKIRNTITKGWYFTDAAHQMWYTAPTYPTQLQQQSNVKLQ